MVDHWSIHQPITCGVWFFSPGGQAQGWSSLTGWSTWINAHVIVVLKEFTIVIQFPSGVIIAA